MLTFLIQLKNFIIIFFIKPLTIAADSLFNTYASVSGYFRSNTFEEENLIITRKRMMRLKLPLPRSLNRSSRD
jgi:hypothetical protein